MHTSCCLNTCHHPWSARPALPRSHYFSSSLVNNAMSLFHVTIGFPWWTEEPRGAHSNSRPILEIVHLRLRVLEELLLAIKHHLVHRLLHVLFKFPIGVLLRHQIPAWCSLTCLFCFRDDSHQRDARHSRFTVKTEETQRLRVKFVLYCSTRISNLKIQQTNLCRNQDCQTLNAHSQSLSICCHTAEVFLAQP